ncbi:hypothetical protein G159_16265 [Planococcus glaciei CHR43]|uniref:glycosyltransferase n=1 Tax=Planococcus glaciei TaxID=459472 RepID=UPI0003DF32F2|nr:glycosyltransferase [Planococcus glaciei]ETP67653.1 hypothetical protein G159_16265 [Planococcus glaciei CHR43]
MKVLQINSVCGVGSTGRIATDIHSLLEEQGHESWIAYGRGEAKNCKNTIKIGSDFSNYKHVAKTRLLDKHGLGSKKATEIFIEKVKKLNPDIIHLHNIHGYYINIEVLFKYLKQANKKVVWTLHDCWAFTGHCSHFDYVGCERWHNGCFDCPQKKEYPSSFLLDNSKENYSMKKHIFNGVENLTIITPSMWLAKLVKKSFLKEYSVKVINNGIDLKSFKPTNSMFKSQYQIENKHTILGIANVWGEKKGLNHILNLSNIITKDEVIVLVGVTESQKASLPNNIKGITKTDNLEELAEIYSAADVFINPTLEDSFPTTNLESIACGTPVITYPTGGSVESINSNCGAIVKNKNINDLYVQIQKFKIKPLKQESIVAQSKKYDKKDCYENYLNYYIKLARGE